MNVHLAGSIRNPESITNLADIKEIIQSHGCTLAHNWVEAALIRHQQNITVDDWTPFVQSSLAALQRSDLVIIEATEYSFDLGYQTAAALEHKKPILVLSKDLLDHQYISGFIDTPLSYTRYSSKDDLQRVISQFIKKNTIHTKELRFNMMINRKISKYLEEEVNRSRRTRSEIIRDVIKRRINS